MKCIKVYFCKGINELREFIEEANREIYEIIAMSEAVKVYFSYYTILYRQRLSKRTKDEEAE